MLAPARSTVTVVPVEHRCPGAEFSLKQDTCVLVEEVAAEITCRAGSKFLAEAEACVRVESFPAERMPCPTGFSATEGGECVKTETAPAQAVCESAEHALVNGECWRWESRAAATAVCPKGYQLTEGNRCVYSTNTSAAMFCPSGYEAEMASRTCVRYEETEVVQDCPEGSVFHAGVCVAAEETRAAAVVDRGFGGLLSEPLEQQPNTRCMSGGSVDELGRCVSTTSVDADIVCPAGFAMNGGRCDKPSVAAAAYRCPANYVLQGENCVKSIPAEKYCRGERETLTVAGTCISLRTEPPVRQCPQRSILMPDGTCAVQVIYEDDFESFCEPNFVLLAEANVCVRILKSIDVTKCPLGYAFDGSACIRARTARPQYLCAGETYHEDAPRAASLTDEARVCQTVTSIDATFSCPRGAEWDAPTGECRVKKIYHPTAFQCDEGFSLKPKSRECVSHKVVKPELHCGLSDLAVLDAETAQCVRTIPVDNASHRCADGYEKKDAKTCTRVTEVFATKICPPDYKLVGNACVGKIPTDTQTLSADDRRLILEALHTYKKSQLKSPLRTEPAAAAANLKVTANDQELLNGMAELIKNKIKRNKALSAYD